MNTLDINEPIVLTDGTYRFVAQAGAVVRLRRDDNGAVVDLHAGEIARMAVGLPPVFDRSPRALEMLPGSNQALVNWWAGHIEEVDSGRHPVLNRALPTYDITKTTQEHRIQAKLRELAAEGRTVSRAGFYRKLADYRAHGAAGLIDGRSLRKNPPLGRLDTRVHDALTDAIARQTKQSTKTRRFLIDTTRSTLVKDHGAAVLALVPSDASMYRYIDTLTRGLYTNGSARTRRSAALRPDRTLAKSCELLPGAQAQIDSTPLDILVWVDGEAVRPILTVMMDVATRSILGFTMRLDAAKAADHGDLLTQAVTPPQNRPDKSAHRKLVQLRNPTITLLTKEQLERAWSMRPVILPRRIMMDNGKDFNSITFRNAARLVGCDVTVAAPHTPTDKAIVERNFKSLATLFLEALPGYVAGYIENRGSNVEREDLYDVEALYELFDDWVVDVWQNRPHDGLRDATNPSVRLSPNEAAAQSARVIAQISLPLTRDEFIELQPAARRKITRTGVSLHSRQYDSPDLHPLRDTRSSDRGGKWDIRYQPYNSQVIWVRGRNNEWIECVCRDSFLLDEPFAEDLLPNVRKREKYAQSQSQLTGSPLQVERIEPRVAVPSDFDDDELAVAVPTLNAFDPNEELL